MRRKKGAYFRRTNGTPPPISVSLKRRISFSEVDPMGVLWHGRYAFYFEQANEKLGRRCGMSYSDFMQENLRAPVVQFHVDYFASPMLAEEITTIGRFIWNEGARMNIEYEIIKEDGTFAASGYTVQMFVTDAGEPLLTTPPMLERCRKLWVEGKI